MKKLFISVAILVGWSLCVNSQDAKEIVRKAYEKSNGNSSYTEMTMKIVRPTYERSISMKAWSLGTKYSMVYITAPAKEKGQVHMKRDKEMWNWQPTINRMIKLPPSMMMQSWMGSDFTNDDLINQASIVNDYTHKILGSENYDNYKCYKIELIPKENSNVVWGKIILLISKDEDFILKSEYFDEDQDLIKTELASEIKILGGKNIPTKFTTIPADKQGNKTIMIMDNIIFDYKLDEAFFTQQNMKKVK
ncbi:MAG TPA: outer membrane lipoprotein-sorting protein [Bacteroidales bacterium]|nr:outer membrane lipoprotein-sorting protein [Bacteroidales bacterium]